MRDFIDENGDWKCTMCGKCCRDVDKLMPWLDRGDGACINLQPDNSCAIYETRPQLCRTDTSWSPWINAASCKYLNEVR